MDPRGIFSTGTRRSGSSWVVLLALVTLWVAVTAITLWELTTVAPTLRRVAASVNGGDQSEVVVLRERPKPELF
jgi:hypothetical protein